ncbi:MAG: sigma-70 family RNA polymerase sigma factor [Deferribacteres bacterium]|nr:sigma-70 family RNA polymerase sigma factor [candidate division KSB1 bacterium]MCB9512207.1 sigma-70 family RNA polymerase sigma factor [Deferribacteres bacterium]
MTDEQLIRKYLDGDIEAFNTLVWRWQKPIYNFTLRYFKDREHAKDATQRVFVKVFKNLKHLKDSRKFSSWIYQIALNLCKDETKSKYYQTTSSLDELKDSKNFDVSSETDSSAYAGHNPENTLERRELRSLLERALDQIPAEQKEVVVMKEFQGLKFIEIAEILELPINTVKSRMYYGLHALRKILDKWNIDKEAIAYEL